MILDPSETTNRMKSDEEVMGPSITDETRNKIVSSFRSLFVILLVFSLSLALHISVVNVSGQKTKTTSTRRRRRLQSSSLPETSCCDATQNIFECCDPSWNILPSDSSKLSVYEVTTSQMTDGCAATDEGNITATCPTGIVLLSPAIEKNAPHQECKLIDNVSVECSLFRDRPIRVACYGSTESDVVLDVSVGSLASGICDSTLNLLSAWPLIATYGGSASYGVSLTNKCSGNFQTISSLDCDGDVSGVGSSRACGMDASCSSAYACTIVTTYFGPLPVCSGNTSCIATFDPISLAPSSATCTEDFTRSVALGGECNVNANCESGICIDVCEAATRSSGELCYEDADCNQGACGREVFDPSAPVVCCESGARASYGGLEYCTGQPANASCGLNVMCTSDICSFGKCRETYIPDREPCEEGRDCANGVCETYFPDFRKGCCPEGGIVGFESESNPNVTDTFCSDLPAGSRCQVDSDCDKNICVFGVCKEKRGSDMESCQSNNHCETGRCGLAQAKEDASTICCPKGEASIYDVSWDYDDYWICHQLKNGQACLGDSQCSSGSCLKGKCLDGRLEDREACDSSADCLSGRCGLSEYTENAPSICCQEGDAIFIDVDWSYTDQWVCTHTPVGDRCITDGQCESGTCFQLECQAERKSDLEICDSNADCKTGRCGLAESYENSPLICCQNGDAIYTDQWICTHTATGGKCISDSQCQSGSCFQGECQARRQPDLEGCDSDADCISGRCGLAEESENAPLICCRDALFMDVTWSYSDSWVCRHIPTGGACTNDELCLSGTCFEGKCQANRQPDLNSCDSNADCDSGLCGLAEEMEGAPLICCDAIYMDVEWSYTDFWVCSKISSGSQCSSDSLCQSGVCFQGVCQERRQADLENCDSDADCISGRCGLAEESENAPLICCQNGDSLFMDVEWSYTDAWVCSHISAGGKCSSDALCQSGVCFQGTCQESRQADLDNCDSNADCQSGGCAKNERLESAEMVCCPGGGIELLEVEWDYRDEYFCSSGPDAVVSQMKADGETCTEAIECQNSRGCAFDSFSETANLVCCSEYYLLDVSWDYKDYFFCGNLQEGASCGDDRMCTSGLCINGACASARVADGETCQKANDCENRACGYSSFSEFANLVCCEAGEIHLLDVDWEYNDWYFCGQLSKGTTCGDDRMCASGHCINGACASTSLPDGEACLKANDCGNRTCGYDAFSEFAKLMCCPGGERYLLDVDWDYNDWYFCGQLPEGSTCGSDSMCGSGHCINGECASVLLSNGESCLKSSDCGNKTCGLGAYLETANLICCDGGELYTLDVPWDYNDHSFCGQLPLNTTCGDDRMCASGLCIDSVCSSARLAEGKECVKSNDCKSRTCALESFSEFAASICCKGGEMYTLDVPWDYNDYSFCGQLPLNTTCGDDRMCASGLCIDSVCANERLPDGMPCTKSNDCSSRACGAEFFAEEATSICCKGGRIYLLDVPWDYNDVFFCGELPLDSACGDDRMCASSLCIDSRCAGAALEDGAPCGKGSDCTNAACALNEYSEFASLECCIEGELYTLDVAWDYRDQTFCGNLATGKTCLINNQCFSKSCVGAADDTPGICA